VLPTGGAGRSFDGLTVDQFQRRTSVVEYSKPALRKALKGVEAFAGLEGLDGHGRSAAIRLESSGSAIFQQKRSGRHGAPFTMYKFRTMHSNAEMQQAELKALNEMSGPVFKIKKDPRITKVGAFLRFTSLDELPQLFNVWFGQMSLVGPRPLPTYETLAMTANAQRRRLSVSPGMTCLWQISGRNEVKDFSDWVRLDLEYIDRWSLWLDFQILLRTIPAVLFGRGAR
jgi:lipopolysaccharide/colanic/teichoic acid biosynthesis glycosyltransferase